MMDSFKDKFSARFQNLMRVFEYHLRVQGLASWKHYFLLLLGIILNFTGTSENYIYSENIDKI